MASIEELQELWTSDCSIDKSSLDVESLKIPELHNKYYKLYIKEKLRLKQLDAKYQQLYKLKHDYFSGKMDPEERTSLGWEPMRLLVGKDLSVYLNADQELIDQSLLIAAQQEKISFLESIIDNINKRGFLIKNAIDFLKWSNGGS
jgi:hypothetical protein